MVSSRSVNAPLLLYLLYIDGLEYDGARVLVALPLALPLLCVDHVPLQDLEPLSGRHLVERGLELADVVVSAVLVVVEHLHLDPPAPVAVAQLAGGEGDGGPAGGGLVLDPLGAVHQGVAAAVRVQARDGEERVRGGEQVLLVQVRAGQFKLKVLSRRL